MLVIEAGASKARGKVDLYEDSAVHKYCRQAGEKLGVSGELLEVDVNLLTDELEAYRMRFEELEQGSHKPLKHFEISPAARKQAKKFLSGENLFSRLSKLIGKTGIVGEEQTRFICLLWPARTSAKIRCTR